MTKIALSQLARELRPPVQPWIGGALELCPRAPSSAKTQVDAERNESCADKREKGIEQAASDSASQQRATHTPEAMHGERCDGHGLNRYMQPERRRLAQHALEEAPVEDRVPSEELEQHHRHERPRAGALDPSPQPM
jgi:hypothetical protein